MAIADATAKNNAANIGSKKTEIKLDDIGDETKKTSSWLAKIFGLQDDEIRRQKERDREADRASRNQPGGGGPGGGGDAKKVSALGKMMRVALAPLLMTVKAISVMFAKIGKFVTAMKKFTKILLKPLLFTFAALSGSIAGVIALWAGLALLVGAFAGITVASLTMSDKDFDKLKMDIANGIAGAIRNTVKFAMDTWNDYTPDSWNIDPQTQKSFEDATFANVSETIVSVMDFIKEMGTAFGEGFGKQMESFKNSWKDFKEVFDRIFDLFSGGVDKVGEFDVGGKVKTGVMAGAKVIGGAIAFISEFFLDLATALGSTMVLREKAKTDNVLINAVANILGSVINFVKDLFEAFGKGFQSKFDKIGESLQGTKEAFGRLFDFAVDLWNKAKEIIGTIGGGKDKGPSKSLLGAFTRFGELVGDMVASIFDVITILIDFMINPQEISGRARANVANLFADIGDAISDVFGSLFTKEAILKGLKNVLGDGAMFAMVESTFGSLEEVSTQAAKNKAKEIMQLEAEHATDAKLLARRKKQLADEKAKAEGDQSKEVIENITFELAMLEGRMERNKDNRIALDEDIKDSKRTIQQQKLNRLVTEEMGESHAAQLSAVEDLKEDIVDASDTFSLGGLVGQRSTASLADLEKFRKIMGDKTTTRQAKLDAMRFEGIDERDIERIMKKLADKEKELAAKKDELAKAQEKVQFTEDVVKKKFAKQLNIDPVTGLPITGKKQGGLVGLSPFTQNLTRSLGLESGGLFTLSQGEFVLDNQAAQTFMQAALLLKGQDLSGISLMDLQRERLITGGAGGNPIVIQDNSQRQVNQSQPLILPPSPIEPDNRESPGLLN